MAKSSSDVHAYTQKRWIARNWRTDPPNAQSDFTINYDQGSLNISQGNPYYKLGKTAGDIGGPFWVTHRKFEQSSSLGSGPLFHFSDKPDPMATNDVYHYLWPQSVGNSIGGIPTTFANPWVSTDSTLMALGTEGIARTLPTKSQFDLSTFIGELKEGIPKATGFASQSNRISNRLADENLNYQFGLAPIIREVQDFASTVRNAEATLDAYLARAGKRTKGSTTLVDEETYTQATAFGTTSARPGNAMVTGVYSNLGNCRKTATEYRKRRVWFEGCYTYFIPTDPFRRRAHLADKLLGTTPDLATLWNLTPWSWAADWASNLGSVVENASAFLEDGLVMHYGYVMEHTQVIRNYSIHGVGYKSYPGEASFNYVWTTESKKRLAASPFGFGLIWDDFTPRQASILASLGISRARR